MAIAAITLAELRLGRLVSTREGKADSLARLLGAITVIPYDESIAEVHATLLAEVRRQGRPRGAHDLIIAATAAASNRTIVTADLRAFGDLPGVEGLTHR